MPFKPSESQQAFLKMSMYGPPGSGKSFSALLMAEGLAKYRGKKVAVIDCEHGTDLYTKEVKARPVHPQAFTFDAIYTKSIATALMEVKAFDAKAYGVLVVDQISQFWDSALEAYPDRTKANTIPIQAWYGIKRPFKQLIAHLMALPCDVIVLGRQKSVFETEDGEFHKVGVAMKAEGESAYEFNINARLETKIDPQDTTQSMVLLHIEKDRSGVLQGRKYTNPNFKTIEPVLLVLTDTTQAPMEDEAERLEADSEIAKAEEAAKAAKSADVYAGLARALADAQDAVALGVVVKDMKKLKKLLLEEHVEALRIGLESSTKRVNEKSIGAL